MDKEDKNHDRREFFKCCAKAALPIIGGILLSKTEAVAKALESADCNYGCSYSCRMSCRSACMGSCSGSCASTCSSACSGSCKNTCSKGCASNCQNTSKAEPAKKDTICQKTDTIQKKRSK